MPNEVISSSQAPPFQNDVLRSRARRKIPWDRKEFMSSNFRVRVEHPDGSTTSEVN